MMTCIFPMHFLLHSIIYPKIYFLLHSIICPKISRCSLFTRRREYYSTKRQQNWPADDTLTRHPEIVYCLKKTLTKKIRCKGQNFASLFTECFKPCERITFSLGSFTKWSIKFKHRTTTTAKYIDKRIQVVMIQQAIHISTIITK